MGAREIGGGIGRVGKRFARAKEGMRGREGRCEGGEGDLQERGVAWQKVN